MVDQAKLLERIELWRRCRVEVQVREWEAPGALPALDLGLDFRRPEEVCLFRSGSTLLLRRHIHVWAAAVVFRAVSAR